VAGLSRRQPQDLAMPVTDEPLVLLHAYLSGEYEIAQALTRELTASGPAGGIAELVYVRGIRPRSTAEIRPPRHGDVIRFAARVRAQRTDQPDALDPLAAEHQLRSALGETITSERPSAGDGARAQVILLEPLLRSENLDEPAQASLLNQAREIANAMPPRRTRSRSRKRLIDEREEGTKLHESLRADHPRSGALSKTRPPKEPFPETIRKKRNPVLALLAVKTVEFLQ
jgi:hypothetical protein